MKLFGQPSYGDWDTPLALIAEALKEKVTGHANEVEYVRLADGAEIAVNGALDDLSSYVLKEQQGWFDPEYRFLLENAQQDMRMMDVGAGVGAYAIALAKAAPAGRFWAIAQAPDEINLLMKSRLRNGLEDSVKVVIATGIPSLDNEMDRHGLDDITLLRLSAQTSNADVLKEAGRYFSVNSPLVMFGIRPGADFIADVPQWFIAHGYGLYRLVPGLNLLVPLTSLNELDVFCTNLFACKADRAQVLERQGLLIRQQVVLTELPGVDVRRWQEYLKAMPYATAKVDSWIGMPEKRKDWEVYWMGLNLWAMAQSARPGAERYACLQTAHAVLLALVQEQASLPRLLSLSRVLTDLGKREAAVGLLNQICTVLNSGVAAELDEPCLALSDAFAAIDTGDRTMQWIVAMVLAQRENLRAFTDFFTGREALPVLQEIQALGFGSEEIDRRIALIKARFAI
jgi:hypothetical protein